MAFETQRFALTTTFQEIHAVASGRAEVWTFIPQATSGTIEIGDSASDTTTARWDVSVSSSWTVTRNPGETMWLKVSSSTMNVDVVKTG